MIRALGLSALTLGLCSMAYACSSSDPEAPPLGSGGVQGEEGGGPNGGAAGDGSGGTAPGGNGGTSNGGSSSGGSSSAGNGGTSSGGGFAGTSALPNYPDAGFSYEPSDAGTEPCAAVTGEATLRKKPMDIIVSIDNSASMAGEIEAVQQRINDDFAAIIENSGIDYRVIMVSRYGNVHIDNTANLPYDGAFAVCIGDPLGGEQCPADADDPTPVLANNRPNFFHHNTNIGSNNMWCQLTGSFNAFSDDAPDGWQAWLRPNAFKVFIGITDDSPLLGNTSQGRCDNGTSFTDNLAGAEAFDAALLALSSQFGTEQERNYAWYSIVGMAGNDDTDPTPLGPNEAVETQCCQGDGSSDNCPPNPLTTPASDGVRAGTGYQELSRMTGGLRYPSCFNDNFNDMFNAIAQGVIERSSASCEYALPDPESGTINPANIVATYNPSADAGPNVDLSRVSAEDQCASTNGFYLDDNDSPTRLSLCPAACQLVQADDGARIDINFGCLGS